MFWHVTLPNIRWGLLYGVILTNARAMGEFGAVSVISGGLRWGGEVIVEGRGAGGGRGLGLHLGECTCGLALRTGGLCRAVHIT